MQKAYDIYMMGSDEDEVEDYVFLVQQKSSGSICFWLVFLLSLVIGLSVRIADHLHSNQINPEPS